MEDSDDLENQARINSLIKQINENQFEFPLYQELIELYRVQGDIEELRQVRERVFSLYCLPVDMWLEWIEDEERVVMMEAVSEVDGTYDGQSEAVQRVLDLFDRAVHEYRYYKVCRRYCKFILKLYHHGKAVPEQKIRDVHEFILQLYGLEVNRSQKFWDPYLKFEKDLL